MVAVSPTVERPAIRAVLPGLLLAMLLAMLDAMIVSTAMPTIVGQLGGFRDLSWVVTAYMLTSTVTTPLWGKYGDLYGRKRMLLLGIAIFLVGSALSGTAQSMTELIIFRALQGVGAGGLLVGVVTMIGVLAPPEQRGKYMSYIAALSAVATVGGPLVGGVLTDDLSWRWAFYINLPIGAIAMLIIFTQLHLPQNKISHRLDYLGAAVITATTTAIVLLCVWAGTRYAWSSVQVIVLLVVAVVGLVATIFVERRAAEPVFIPSLFAVRNFSVSLVLGFLVGIALYGSITFLPLYQQNVQHTSATGSGLLLLPVLVGMLITSMLSGVAMSKPANHRPFAILGGVALAVGSLLLMQLTYDTSRVLSSLYMVVFGVGLGFLFQNVVVIAQNSVTPQFMGGASGSVVFFRTIGGVLGVSVFAAVFSSRLHDYLASRLTKADLSTVTSNGGQLNSTAVRALSPSLRAAYVHGVAHAIQGVFTWALPVGVLAFLAGFAVQVKKQSADASQAEPTKEQQKA